MNCFRIPTLADRRLRCRHARSRVIKKTAAIGQRKIDWKEAPTMATKVWQQPLPEIYTQLSDPELRLRIEAAKDALRGRLVILGHHYQQDAVIDYADFTGDSFELSRKAADQKGIDYVVFCGVHF